MMPDQRPSRVTLILKDGTRLRAVAFVNKGDFEDPYSAEDLHEKYYELALPVWGEGTAQKVWSALTGLDEISDVREVTCFLTP